MPWVCIVQHRVARRISFKVNYFIIVLYLYALLSLPVDLKCSLVMKTQVYFVYGCYVLMLCSNADDTWSTSLLDRLFRFSLTVAEKYQGYSFRKAGWAVKQMWHENTVVATNTAWHRENSPQANDPWDLRVCCGWRQGQYSEYREKSGGMGPRHFPPTSIRAHFFLSMLHIHILSFISKVLYFKEGKTSLETSDSIAFYMRKEAQDVKITWLVSAKPKLGRIQAPQAWGFSSVCTTVLPQSSSCSWVLYWDH